MKQVKIRKRLKANDIRFVEAQSLVGKDVEIIINELKPESAKGRQWKSAGSARLKGKLDKLNIRDLAHD